MELLVQPTPISVYGTLVLGMFYNEGVVLAGDTGGSIGHDEEEYVLRDQKKVIVLSGGTIMGASGNTLVLDADDTDIELFNAMTLTKDYFERTPFRGTIEFWDGLKSQILTELNQYIQSSGDTTATTLQMVFFYLDEQNVIRMKDSFLKHDGSNPAKMTITQSSTPPIICMGYCNVLDDLMGSGQRFAYLRKHASVKPFTEGKLRFEDITLQRALLFIKKVMEVSSTVEPSKGHVNADFTYETLLGTIDLEMPG